MKYSFLIPLEINTKTLNPQPKTRLKINVENTAYNNIEITIQDGLNYYAPIMIFYNPNFLKFSNKLNTIMAHKINTMEQQKFFVTKDQINNIKTILLNEQSIRLIKSSLIQIHGV